MPIEISAVVRIGIAGWGNIFILSYLFNKDFKPSNSYDLAVNINERTLHGRCERLKYTSHSGLGSYPSLMARSLRHYIHNILHCKALLKSIKPLYDDKTLCYFDDST